MHPLTSIRLISLPGWLEGWFTLRPDSIEGKIQTSLQKVSNWALATLSCVRKDYYPQDIVLTSRYTRNELISLYLIIYTWVQ